MLLHLVLKDVVGTFGRVLVPQRFKNLSLYHEIIL